MLYFFVCFEKEKKKEWDEDENERGRKGEKSDCKICRSENSERLRAVPCHLTKNGIPWKWHKLISKLSQSLPWAIIFFFSFLSCFICRGVLNSMHSPHWIKKYSRKQNMLPEWINNKKNAQWRESPFCVCSKCDKTVDSTVGGTSTPTGWSHAKVNSLVPCVSFIETF